MKGLLAGLVLGFAIGAGVTCWRLAPDRGGTPRRPERPSRVGAPEAPPQKQPPLEPPSVNVKTPEELLTVLESLAEGEAPPGRWKVAQYGLVFTRELKRRARRFKEVCVPRALVEKLLGSRDRGLRLLGADLVILADPEMTDRIVELGLDPDPQIRRQIITNAGMLPADHPAVLRLVRAATEDPEPEARARAVHNLGRLSSRRPEVAQRILAASRDEDPTVRYAAASLLDRAGRDGQERAFEILTGEEHHPDLARDLARLVAESGRALEALDHTGNPDAVTPLLQSNSDSGDPDAKGCLAGRFDELLPLFLPEDEDYQAFFLLAAEVGESGFLRKTVASSKRSQQIRRQALEAGLDSPETQLAVLAGARESLGREGARPTLRLMLVEAVENLVGEDEPGSALAEDILREVSESDRNAHVPRAAREALDGE